MFIKRLLIEETRNLKMVSLDDFGLFNFFMGDNGSGKTSLLEAISIASQGRSFRSNKIQTVINQEGSQLRVFIECENENKHTHKLGIQRDRKNNYLVRIDGNTATTLAELSSILPVLVIDTTAFDLLDGSSSVRRKFIDWGVFHVEHSFFDAWRAFSKILKQRNALLASNNTNYKDYEPWDKELIHASLIIEHLRVRHLAQFQEKLKEALQALDTELLHHTIFYKNGWGSDKLDFVSLENNGYPAAPLAQDLSASLMASFDRDLRHQTTHLGPHKADIQLRTNNNDIKDIYSRGQKKILVSAMKLAQAKTVKQSISNKSPVLLLDDLSAELDEQHLNKFLMYVAQEQYQCFITAVDNRMYMNNMHVNARMFHVKHGKITRIKTEEY